MTKTTDDQTELFYHVDERDQVIGSITRAQAHDGTKKLHRSVAILVFNENRTAILLQQRSLTKDTNPGFWTVSASGHVTFGHEYYSSAKKELMEEIGLKTPIKEETKIIISDKKENEWCTVFSTTTSTDLVFTLHPQEVEKVQWVPINELNSFIESNSFSPCGKQALQAYFDFIV